MAGVAPIQLSALSPMPAMPSMAASQTSTSSPSSFASTLSQALQQVNQLQTQAQQAEDALLAGQTTDFSQAIVAVEKASLAVQLTVEVRNRALDAYQEVMRMQM